MPTFRLRKHGHDRPKPVLTYTRLMAAADVVAGLAIAVTVLLLARAWMDLPDRIPVHFGPKGQPDGWGGKGTLLIGPITAIASVVLLAIVNRSPHTFNYPIRLTAENAQRQYTIARELMAQMRAWMAILGAALALMQVQAARVGVLTPTMITSVLGFGIGAPIVLLIVYFRRAKAAA